MKTEDLITNSQRRLFRVAYTPLSVRATGAEGDALTKAALIRSLGLTKDEARSLDQRQGAVPTILALTDARTEGEYMAELRKVGDMDQKTLTAIAGDLAKLRQSSAHSITQRIRDLDREFVADAGKEQQISAAARPPGNSMPVGAGATPDLPVGQDLQGSSASPARSVELAAAPPVVEASKVMRRDFLPLHSLVVEQIGAAAANRFPQMIEWAAEHRPVELAEFRKNVDVHLPQHPAKDNPEVLITAANLVLPKKLRQQIIAQRVKELIAERVFDLVGLLHLERLVMTPAQVERGELLYSLPLAPRETVTLSHKEWAIREEEYSRYIQDYMENYSETGVAQTTEMAKSTETQTRRQDATSANLTSMSAQPVTVTSPVDAGGGSVVEAAGSTQQSVLETRMVTTKATSRTIQDHRISFTVTTVRGSEDWTSRLLRNNHADKTMMVDYFRRIRWWRNELYRYGVRLTYDIVVPHPGRRVLDRYNRLREIERELAIAFQPSVGPGVFDVLGGPWGSAAEAFPDLPLPPRPPDINIEVASTLKFLLDEHLKEVELPIPPGYVLKKLGFQVNAMDLVNSARATVNIGPNEWNLSKADNSLTAPTTVPLPGIPERGPVKAIVSSISALAGSFRLYANVTPALETVEQWKKQCWGIVREAELVKYQEKLDLLRIERLQLQRAIDAADSLSLRRIEREHSMLACLEWLFPFLQLETGWFDNVADSPTDADRVTGLGQSVLIKLMHTAIDWDAMLVTLLPFFWERIDNDAVIFVDHPDPLHREFLRAGAARVVLPIRPGYEDDILSLFDLGLVSSLSMSHRYKTIVDEVTAANKKYLEQSHPAAALLPDGSLDPTYTDDYPLEGGKLIGRWQETMPTGALDMDVTLRDLISV